MATMSSRVQPIYRPDRAHAEPLAPRARPARGASLAVTHVTVSLSVLTLVVVMASTYLAGVMMQYQANYQRARLQDEIRSLRHRNQELRLFRDAAKQAASADDWALSHQMVRNARALILRERAR
jgi:hypothetical protein